MSKVDIYSKLFPYITNAKKVTDKQKEVINGTDIKKKIDVHNKIFGTTIQYCECPEIWKDIEERLTLTLLYQDLCSNS